MALQPTLIAYRLLVVLVVALGIIGCAGNPVSIAETPEQKAYALYGEFVVGQRVVNAVVTAPSTPIPVKDGLKLLEAKVKRVADPLLASVLEVEKIRRQIAAGESTADSLNIASANLLAWVTKLQPLINELNDALRDVR